MVEFGWTSGQGGEKEIAQLLECENMPRYPLGRSGHVYWSFAGVNLWNRIPQ